MVYWILGIFVGLLSGFLGVGGGLLVTPALIFIFHHQKLFITHTTQIAVGSSLAVICFTALSSMIAYQRRKNIDWDLLKYLLPGLLCGSLIGSGLATFVPSNLLARCLGIFVLFMAIQILFPRHFSKHIQRLVSRQDSADTPPLQFGLSLYSWVGLGLMIGIVSGLIGIGGGILLIPILLCYEIPLHRAAGTAIAAAFFVALSSMLNLTLIGYFSSDQSKYIFWPAVFKIAATSIIFAWVGATIASFLPTNFLKRIFAGFLLAVGIYLLLGLIEL